MKFCINGKCPFKDCIEHNCHAPRGFAYTAVDMDKTCRRYIDYLVDEAEKAERMKAMGIGDAVRIFVAKLDDDSLSDEEKGQAIWMVLNMPTHNGIKKDAMLKAIRWLMGMVFELPEEGAEHERDL